MTNKEIGQLLSDQMTHFLSQRKPALIEAEPYDDEDTYGFDPLSRWGDRKFTLTPKGDGRHPALHRWR